jgi:hypothetical protein
MKRFIEPVFHFLIWLSGYLVVILYANTVGHFHREGPSFFFPVTLGTLVNVMIFYIVALVLIPKYSVNRKVAFFVSASLVLLLFLSLLETGIDYLFFTSYYSSVKEPLFSQFLMNLLLNLIILSLALGYGFSKVWIHDERVRKTQINPHFLFNVLNMAYSSSIRHGDETTADIIEKLAGLMRYMLYESNGAQVALEKEIEYLHHFINLQKLRMSNEVPLVVNFDVSGDVHAVMIAPLLLIPFVENAFKHGVSLDRPSSINIRLSCFGSNLDFFVENPIHNQRQSAPVVNSGIGLQNVRKRLELLYPERHMLVIDDTGDRFRVSLTIQIH